MPTTLRVYQLQTEHGMKKLARWVTLIFAFFFAALIYGVWSKIDSEGGAGSLSDLIRSGVLSIFL